jgi:hypothetical protein
MRLHILQSLNWFLIFLSLMFTGLSLWGTRSDSMVGLVVSLSAELSSLFILGGLLCSIYTPVGGSLISPNIRKYLLWTYAFASLLLLAAGGLTIAGFYGDRVREVESRALSSDIGEVESELKQFETKSPTQEEVMRLNAKLADLKVRINRLEHQH